MAKNELVLVEKFPGKWEARMGEASVWHPDPLEAVRIVLSIGAGIEIEEESEPSGFVAWLIIDHEQGDHRWITLEDPLAPPPPGHLPSVLQRSPERFTVRPLVAAGEEPDVPEPSPEPKKSRNPFWRSVR